MRYARIEFAIAAVNTDALKELTGEFAVDRRGLRRATWRLRVTRGWPRGQLSDQPPTNEIPPSTTNR